MKAVVPNLLESTIPTTTVDPLTICCLSWASSISDSTKPSRVLVTDNPGCIMHLRGGIDAQKLPVVVLRIVELMAAQLHNDLGGRNH